jgi:hypothetical protein
MHSDSPQHSSILKLLSRDPLRMDVFEELRFLSDGYVSKPLTTPTSDLHSEDDGAIMSDPFFAPLLQLEPRYSFPKNSEALRIWNACKLYEVEMESRILRRLYRWANHYKLLQYDAEKHELYISWKSPSGTIINSTWKTFQKWFLCACGPV